jgi:hypothetical protein
MRVEAWNGGVSGYRRLSQEGNPQQKKSQHQDVKKDDSGLPANRASGDSIHSPRIARVLYGKSHTHHSACIEQKVALHLTCKGKTKRDS